MIVRIKSKEEKEGFIKAGKEAARILSKLFHHVQPGWTPADIDNIAREECEKVNAKPVFLGYREFPAAICFSKNDVLVHGIPDNIPLKKGDLVSIDFGVDIDGFIGDTADTVIVGEDKDKEQSKLISECRFALFKAIKAAVPGNNLSDIGREVKGVADKWGYKIPENYGGHGLDRGKLHAPPFVSNIPDYSNDFMLRDGMVLAIEPMFIDARTNDTSIKSDGWAVKAKGMTSHCEHTVLVSDDGPIVLTDRLNYIVR